MILASSQSCSQEALFELAQDHEYLIRAEVAKNNGSSAGVLERFADEDNFSIIRTLLLRDDLPQDTLYSITCNLISRLDSKRSKLQDSVTEAYYCYLAISHSKAEERTLVFASSHPDIILRSAVISHPLMSEETIEDMLRDPINIDILDRLVSHKNADSVVKRICAEKEIEIEGLPQEYVLKLLQSLFLEE